MPDDGDVLTFDSSKGRGAWEAGGGGGSQFSPGFSLGDPSLTPWPALDALNAYSSAFLRLPTGSGWYFPIFPTIQRDWAGVTIPSVPKGTSGTYTPFERRQSNISVGDSTTPECSFLGSPTVAGDLFVGFLTFDGSDGVRNAATTAMEGAGYTVTAAPFPHSLVVSKVLAGGETDCSAGPTPQTKWVFTGHLYRGATLVGWEATAGTGTAILTDQTEDIGAFPKPAGHERILNAHLFADGTGTSLAHPSFIGGVDQLGTHSEIDGAAGAWSLTSNPVDVALIGDGGVASFQSFGTGVTAYYVEAVEFQIAPTDGAADSDHADVHITMNKITGVTDTGFTIGELVGEGDGTVLVADDVQTINFDNIVTCEPGVAYALGIGSASENGALQIEVAVFDFAEAVLRAGAAAPFPLDPGQPVDQLIGIAFLYTMTVD